MMFRAHFTSLGQIGATVFPQPGLLYTTMPAVGKTPLSSCCIAAMDELWTFSLKLDSLVLLSMRQHRAGTPPAHPEC